MNRRVAVAVWLIGLIALAVRLVDLDRRPMHADEAVQGLKFIRLLESGEYKYDPDEYHGPTLNYLTLPVAWVRGERNRIELTETTLRLVPVLFGSALAVFVLFVTDGLGRCASVVAALLTAVSPALVFYSRYYIHETLLVFFTFGFIVAGWRYLRTGRVGWVVVAGIFLGLMHATKETFVIAVFAMVLAGVVVVVWERKRSWQPGEPSVWKIMCRPVHVVTMLGVAAAVSVVFYTSFFQNWRGPVDSLVTYLPWFRRAGGASPHIHPWWFYLERWAYFKRQSGVVWTEAPLIGLALFGLIVAARPGLLPGGDPKFMRFVAAYSLVLAVTYSVISYKTPWCMLGFYHGFVMVAAIGVAGALSACRQTWSRAVLSVLLLAGLGQLCTQTWRAAYAQPADRRNPYVYAHTSPNLLRLVQKVESIASVHPDPGRFAIQIMAPGGDYWPLPWYFRKFPHTGWWSEIPEDPYASVMVVSTRFNAELDEKSNKRWLMVGVFEGRPGVFFELYVELELWKRHVATLPRDDD
ncbi:MAG: TIGR03663 family protein [Verrucomicrobiae bacterium]|nr:TIGR03663 family protein [Verrucomicrobiae bacterium]